MSGNASILRSIFDASNFMEHSIAEARSASIANEIPVGAIVVLDGKIIAAAHNLSMLRTDITAHAEILALQQASAFLKSRYLEACNIYVTLEPCPMCAYAISLARVKRLYFGAYDPKSGGIESGAAVYSHKNTHHKPECYGGIKERQCAELLKNFFFNRRHKDS